LSLELIPVSWQSAHSWLSHKLGSELPLLSARLTVIFTAPWLVPNKNGYK